MKISVIFFMLISSFLYPNGLPERTQFKPITRQEIAKKTSKETSGRLFFYSYPRSGTHWTCYILKYFTGRLITFPKSELVDMSENTFDSDLSKPSIHAFHRYLSTHWRKFNIKPPNLESDKILIIIRNPLESIIRKNKYVLHQSMEQIVKELKMNNFGLYKNLAFLEKWPRENRYFLYLENLISNPEEEIEKLLLFLEEPLDKLPEFIADLETHRNRSIKLYDAEQKKTGGSYSRGTDLFYHSKNLSKENRETLFRILEKQNPYLFGKYLAWYEDLY